MWEFAGINGFLKLLAVWRCLARMYYCIPQPSVRNLQTQRTAPLHTGSVLCKDMQLLTWFLLLLQTGIKLVVRCAITVSRIGTENSTTSFITFYGNSFITDNCGSLVTHADANSECVISAAIDLTQARKMRASWGLFRDRRPDLYNPILTLDGKHSKYEITSQSHILF